MIHPVLSSSDPVTLVGGGRTTAADLHAALALAPRLAAADSGAVLALAEGLVPAAVIGDFDSLPPAARAELDPGVLHHVAEQDSTDFEKALSRIAAPLVLAVGFTGARVDHELAVLHALVRYAHRPCILLAEEEVVLHCPPRLELTPPAGTRVSLFPMAAVTGRSTGLRWPIAGLDFGPATRVGTSNEATGDAVRLEMDAPGMLLLLPRDQLRPVMRALSADGPSAARWPAP